MGFNKELAAGASALGNWLFRVGGLIRTATSATAVGSQVICSTTGGAPEAGPDHCQYFASPADVIGTNGLPVAAFDIPMQVLP